MIARDNLAGLPARFSSLRSELASGLPINPNTGRHTVTNNAPTRFAVILEGEGGELDRNTYTIPDDCLDPDAFVDERAMNSINGWPLAIGDTVRVVEVQS